MASVTSSNLESTLRQLQLQSVLSSAMVSEGVSYRTLCFILYARVRKCHLVRVRDMKACEDKSLLTL